MDKVVLVIDFEVRPGTSEEVFKYVSENAQAAVTTEPGCYQFDVLRFPDNPDRMMLYEVLRERGRVPGPWQDRAYPGVSGQGAAAVRQDDRQQADPQVPRREVIPHGGAPVRRDWRATDAWRGCAFHRVRLIAIKTAPSGIRYTGCWIF